jgi:hypothetical protein
MSLETTGEISVDVDRATAFAFLEDLPRFARCIPGCTNLREIAPGRYGAVLATRVSFMTVSFKVIGEIARIDPPTAIEAKITGDAVGLAGRLVATAALQLAEAGEQRTTIHYAADVALTGKLGGLGQPILRARSAELAREFAANLKAAIEGGGGEARV